MYTHYTNIHVYISLSIYIYIYANLFRLGSEQVARMTARLRHRHLGSLERWTSLHAALTNPDASHTSDKCYLPCTSLNMPRGRILCTFTYIYIYIYMSICLYVSLSLYIYIYIHIHTYIYVYIYIYDSLWATTLRAQGGARGKAEPGSPNPHPLAAEFLVCAFRLRPFDDVTCEMRVSGGISTPWD